LNTRHQSLEHSPRIGLEVAIPGILLAPRCQRLLRD
jgi:hypothetical protein